MSSMVSAPGTRWLPKGVMVERKFTPERECIAWQSMKRHVPFEFVGKVAGSSAMAEAGDIEGGSRSRHDGDDAG